MATIDLGRIKMVWRGAYNNATAYTPDDAVSYNGSSYICILASTGNLPTNATYFEQMSSAGTNGTNGTDLGTTLTTQGDLVYRDGSGLQRLGAGTAGQVLTTGGAGANPSWGTVSSDFVKLYETSTEYNPGTAYADYSGYFTNDYDHYKIIVMETGTSSGNTFNVLLGGTGGIDTGANYGWQGNYTGAGVAGGHGSTSDNLIRIGWSGDGSFKNSTVIDLVNARNTGTPTHLHAQRFCKDHSSTFLLINTSGYWNSTTAVDQIRILHGTGTIQINSIAIYGYKTS
jgi:hypothetical protein